MGRVHRNSETKAMLNRRVSAIYSIDLILLFVLFPFFWKKVRLDLSCFEIVESKVCLK